jgi:hypothetical protein
VKWIVLTSENKFVKVKVDVRVGSGDTLEHYPCAAVYWKRQSYI